MLTPTPTPTPVLAHALRLQTRSNRTRGNGTTQDVSRVPHVPRSHCPVSATHWAHQKRGSTSTWIG